MKKRSTGSILLLVLVFSAIFFTVLTGISSFVLSENRLQEVRREKDEAFAIAEAGLDYYRWFLSHFPGNLQNGTGHAGPFQITYNDPEGGAAGTYTLSIVGNGSCGQTTSVEVTSTGAPSDAAGVKTTLWARYSKPSVSAYSYIINSSVWAGADRIINGPYHANGGIRMDGTANAPVTSSVSTWNCTPSFGCAATTTESGVFGVGSNQTLWSYPTPQMDFAGISANFSSLKTTAQASGKYFARVSSGASGANSNKGYHIVFNADGTYTVRQVTSMTANTVTPVNGADPTTDYTVLVNQGSSTTYTLPGSCNLIFVEDNVWIEGTIPQKVTLVAANVTTPGIAPNIILRGNLQYAVPDGSDGFTAIAQHDVLISGDSPQTMTLNGTFIAQNGAFGRNLFTSGGNCNATYEPRTQLTILGTTVSNLRTGTKWLGITCASGSTAGYQTRIDAFDRQNATNPPPFTPFTSAQYQFVDWREQ